MATFPWNSMQELMKGVTAAAKIDPRTEEIRRSIAELDEKAAGFEGGSSGRASTPAGSTPPGFVGLNQELSGILSLLDGADAAPTVQMAGAFNELKLEFEKLTAGWTEFEKKDLAPLNQKLKEAGLPGVTP